MPESSPAPLRDLIHSRKGILVIFVALVALVVVVALVVPIAILMARGRIDPQAGITLIVVGVLGGVLSTVLAVVRTIDGIATEDAAKKGRTPPPIAAIDSTVTVERGPTQ